MVVLVKPLKTYKEPHPHPPPKKKKGEKKNPPLNMFQYSQSPDKHLFLLLWSVEIIICWWVLWSLYLHHFKSTARQEFLNKLQLATI